MLTHMQYLFVIITHILTVQALLVQQEKQVKKLYLALVAAPVPVGIITHYMRPVNIAPRIVSGGNVVLSSRLNSDTLALYDYNKHAMQKALGNVQSYA